VPCVEIFSLDLLCFDARWRGRLQDFRMAAVNAPLTPIEASALQGAGPFSLAFFTWVTPYIKRGFKQTLEEKDVRALSADNGTGSKSRNCVLCSYLI